MSCDADALAEIKLFERLNKEDLRELAGVIESTKVNENETLFHAGEPGESLFIVKSGAVELFIKDTAGQKIVLTVAKGGDVFGDLSMLDNRPRSANAQALIDTELFVLDRGDLLLLFQRKPDAALSMMAAMSAMVRRADELLRTRVSRNVNEEMEEKLSALQRIGSL